jgi:hypothetical protein
MLISLLHLGFVHLEQRRPLLLVALDLSHQTLELRTYFHKELVAGLYDEVNEPDLRLGDVRGVAVEQVRHWELVFFFQITLSEKFNI